FMVMQAWASREDAAVRMVEVVRQQRDRVIEVEVDGEQVTVDVGAAQVVGYFGHNLFYDYEDFDWDGLRDVPGRPPAPVGIASVAGKAARVPGFPELVAHNVFVLLLSRQLMSSEGYSTLSPAAGVIDAMSSEELVQHANETYRYWHTIGEPDKRVGRPFLSHDYLMYE